MLVNILIFLLIGAVAGFLAGQLVRGEGFGLIGNIIVGIIGSVVGGTLFGLLNIDIAGLLGDIVVATAGAALLLVVFNAIFNRRR
ncbi:MAG: GlsB/YeaQ/YmgE family stress response membrane protein [Chloroflexi bacterium]|nr:GlsB/YeaQ/YmgE family stress response membrane protein [Chloroflexota bacterium]